MKRGKMVTLKMEKSKEPGLFSENIKVKLKQLGGELNVEMKEELKQANLPPEVSSLRSDDWINSLRKMWDKAGTDLESV